MEGMHRIGSLCSEVKSSQVAFNMIVASTLSYKRNTKYCAIQYNTICRC